ncbi:hypothetical protein JCM10213_001018 [Rhodosporidiobolus nylandii]
MAIPSNWGQAVQQRRDEQATEDERREEGQRANGGEYNGSAPAVQPPPRYYDPGSASDSEDGEVDQRGEAHRHTRYDRLHERLPPVHGVVDGYGQAFDPLAERAADNALLDRFDRDRPLYPNGRTRSTSRYGMPSGTLPPLHLPHPDDYRQGIVPSSPPSLTLGLQHLESPLSPVDSIARGEYALPSHRRPPLLSPTLPGEDAELMMSGALGGSPREEYQPAVRDAPLRDADGVYSVLAPPALSARSYHHDLGPQHHRREGLPPRPPAHLQGGRHINHHEREGAVNGHQRGGNSSSSEESEE